MATWKKVIVSGSTANLAALQVDNLTSGQVVIGGGASNLSTTAINGTGNIVATTGATGLVHSGSFSGSFQGSGAGITGVVSSSYATTSSYASSAGQVSNALSQGTGITSFTYNGSSTATVAVSGASTLSTNAVTKWTGTAFANSSLTDNGTTISGTTSLQLTGANTALTGSFSGSFKGDGSALTGVAASFPTTQVTNLATADSFYVQNSTGSVNSYITYANLLTDIAGTNLTADGDSINLATTITGLTSVTATNFIGTASTASFVTGSNVYGPYGASSVLSASYAVSASYTSTAGQLNNALTLGNGLTGTSYNGSAAVTAAVGAGALIGVGTGITYVNTSSLSANQLPKYSANALAGSNVSDDGTTITLAGTTTNVTSTNFQVGTNKFTVASATGNTVVAGTLSVTGNTTISGDLTVAGTASFQNTQNLLVGDKFILLASGSTSITDGGLIVSTGGGTGGFSGSAWFLESTSAGVYGRWATAYTIHASSSVAVADEYAVTAKINQASNPSAAPTWGDTTSGAGNMWITNAGDIFIYA